jgi:hypothetical protein
MNPGTWLQNDFNEHICIVQQTGLERWDAVWFSESGIKFWPSIALDIPGSWGDYDPQNGEHRQVIKAILDW